MAIRRIGVGTWVADICLRLAEYRAAGLDLPILWPALGIDGAHEVIKAFRQ